MYTYSVFFYLRVRVNLFHDAYITGQLLLYSLYLYTLCIILVLYIIEGLMED